MKTRVNPEEAAVSSVCSGAADVCDQSEVLFLTCRFDTEEEALAIANASNVGLAGEFTSE